MRNGGYENSPFCRMGRFVIQRRNFLLQSPAAFQKRRALIRLKAENHTKRGAPMTDENLYAFISRRERELRHQIAGLKGQLALIQGQLAQREYELVRITHIKATDIIEDALGVANLPQADSN